MKLRAALSFALIFVLSAGFAYAQPSTKLPNLSEVLFNRATESYKKADYDAAIDGYTSYLKMRPDSASGWFNRGMSYYYKALGAPTRELYEKAAADFSQAIKLNPGDAEFWLFRGRAYGKLMVVDFKRCLPLALADFNKAISLAPNSAEAYGSRGYVYYESNDLDKALTDLNKAVQLNTTDAVVYFTRAKILGARNNFSASRADIRAALKIAPGYEAAQIYLEFLDRQELSARNSTAVAVRPAAQPQPSAPAPAQRQPSAAAPAPAYAPAKTSPAGGPSDAVASGYKQAEDAAKLSNHAQVIQHATRTLELIPLNGKELPDDELTTVVYTALLAMRAKSYSALGKHAESDADYKTSGMASMLSTLRYMQSTNNKLAAGKGSFDRGLIMAGLESASAVGACGVGIKTGLEWSQAIQRTRPNAVEPAIQAQVVLIGLRGICAQAHDLDGGIKASYVSVFPDKKDEYLNQAADAFTQALSFDPQNRELYLKRAKAYRDLGRGDLADADEKKAAAIRPK